MSTWTRIVASLCLGGTLFLGEARAGNYFWDSDGDGSNGQTDGNGTFTASSASFYRGSSTDAAFSNNSTLVFGVAGAAAGSSYTVTNGAASFTLNGGIAFAGGSAYTLAGNSFDVNSGAGLGVTVGADVTATETITMGLAVGSGAVVFANDATSSTGILDIKSSISPVSPSGGASLTLAGTGTGTNLIEGNLNQSGAGNFSVGVTGGVWRLSGANNTYKGGMTVTGGTLLVGSATALGATTGSLSVSGGTVDLSGNNATVAALTGSGATAGLVSNGSATGATLTAGSVNAGGVGAVGALTIGGGASAGTATLNATGATLTFDIASNASFDRLTLGSFGALTLSGTTLNLNFIGTSLSAGTLQLVSAANGSQIASLTGLTLGTTTLDGLNASLALDGSGNLDLELSAAPEPGTWMLLLLAGAGFFYGRRVRAVRAA